MILVAGDTHGDIDYRKLDNRKIKSQFGQLPNYVIVAGDFGVPWSNEENNPQDLFMKKWYEAKPYDVIVVLGNHDNYNRIYSLPTEIYHGAKAYRYGKNIVFIEKGEFFELEGKTFFTFGGADSTDKDWRIPDVSWWRQEQATYADFIKLEESLSQYSPKVDYIISHTGPEEVISELGFSWRNDSTSKLLSYVSKKLSFTTWYFGHMHVDKSITVNDRHFICMYNQVHEV